MGCGVVIFDGCSVGIWSGNWVGLLHLLSLDILLETSFGDMVRTSYFRHLLQASDEWCLFRLSPEAGGVLNLASYLEENQVT